MMTYSSDSTSAYLTPLGDVLPKPTIVAETTQGPTSTTFSLNPKIAVISSLLVEGLVDIQDDEGSDISSITDMGFTDLLPRLPTGKTLPTSCYEKEFVVVTANKILENFTIINVCKKKNCDNIELVIKNPVDVYDVNSVTNLDSVKPMGGKKELVQHIQRSIFANF